MLPGATAITLCVTRPVNLLRANMQSVLPSNHVGCLLTDHDAGGLGVAGQGIWHDACIRHPQPIHLKYTAFWIHDGVERTGCHRMIDRLRIGTNPGLPKSVALQVRAEALRQGFRDQHFKVAKALQRGLVQKLDPLLAGGNIHRGICLMGQVVVLHMHILPGQANFAGTLWPVEGEEQHPGRLAFVEHLLEVPVVLGEVLDAEVHAPKAGEGCAAAKGDLAVLCRGVRRLEATAVESAGLIKAGRRQASSGLEVLIECRSILVHADAPQQLSTRHTQTGDWDTNVEVVLQVLSDAWQVHLTVHSIICQLVFRAEPRAQEKAGTGVAPTGDNHFMPGIDLLGLSESNFLHVFHADGLLAIEEDSGSPGMLLDMQVRALSHVRLEKSRVGGLTPAIGFDRKLMRAHHPTPGGVKLGAGAGVVVGCFVPLLLRRAHEGGDIIPLWIPEAHRIGSTKAMRFFIHGRLRCGVGDQALALPKVRKYLLPGPTLSTASCPGIEVPRIAADIGHVVDGSGATEHLPGRQVHHSILQFLTDAPTGAPPGPVDCCLLQPTAGHGHGGVRRRLWPRFQQQNFSTRIFAQSCSNNGPGSTSAHHHKVVGVGCGSCEAGCPLA
mmetsp:Transcript_26320/g.62757  ORF Transcript_26320/g.62757 Transcript_26320/m.62757 type:complete len:610 (+) Transcript_26320:227-2056(+)